MNDIEILDIPITYKKTQEVAKEIGFTMSSDLQVGSLLKTLITSKAKANLLELGTGIGSSLSWMIEGMDKDSVLTTVDNDENLIKIVKNIFEEDKRVNILLADGEEWINNYSGKKFDLIFADTWPGKYNVIDKTLNLVKVGGYYIIDDMIYQPNWPEGHQEKVNHLINYLENRDDFNVTKLKWSTGVIIASKVF